VPDILTPKLLENPEFYKKTILLPEEDVNAQGHRGMFEIREDFNICFLFHVDNVEEIKKTINLPLDLFEFLLIQEN